jgi:hypothetical protein
MIPISLYVTAEVVKSFQAALIEVLCPKLAFHESNMNAVSHSLLRLIGLFIFPQPTHPLSPEPRI